MNACLFVQSLLGFLRNSFKYIHWKMRSGTIENAGVQQTSVKYYSKQHKMPECSLIYTFCGWWLRFRSTQKRAMFISKPMTATTKNLTCKCVATIFSNNSIFAFRTAPINSNFIKARFFFFLPLPCLPPVHRRGKERYKFIVAVLLRIHIQNSLQVCNYIVVRALMVLLDLILNRGARNKGKWKIYSESICKWLNCSFGCNHAGSIEEYRNDSPVTELKLEWNTCRRKIHHK